MPTPVLITQAQLERRFSAQLVRDLSDDTGDGSTTASIVADVTAEASARALALLRPAWTTEEISAMCTGPDPDPAIIGSICDIAIEIISRRRPAFVGVDGAAIYSNIGTKAEKRLEAMAKGNQRPAGETATGAATNGTRFGLAPNRDSADLIFQGSTRNRRGPGGF